MLRVSLSLFYHNHTNEKFNFPVEQIRLMCYEYISNPNAIILAVTAANQDLVNR
jgi:hypothetical protein